jgi:misacylated tRNA(Ala) deacylase
MLKMHPDSSTSNMLRSGSGNGNLVIKLYLEDSYTKEFDARIVGTSLKEIELDRTFFFPRGGGQPFDTGKLALNGNQYNVIEVKIDRETDRIFHVLDQEHTLKEGDIVKGMIDWPQRYQSMRIHTATHVVDGVLIKNNYRCVCKSWHISEDRIGASMVYDFVSEFDQDRAIKVFEQAQKVIDQHLPVTSKMVTKEEALKIPNVARTEPGKQLLSESENVRIVSIGDFDEQMDGGTHVSNTKEIGNIEFFKLDTKRYGKTKPTIKFLIR